MQNESTLKSQPLNKLKHQSCTVLALTFSFDLTVITELPNLEPACETHGLLMAFENIPHDFINLGKGIFFLLEDTYFRRNQYILGLKESDKKGRQCYCCSQIFSLTGFNYTHSNFYILEKPFVTRNSYRNLAQKNRCINMFM